MFKVGQEIFAKQNWTVISAAFKKHNNESDLSIESYSLKGKRGANAILVRQVSNDSKVSDWKLIRGSRCDLVFVYV